MGTLVGFGHFSSCACGIISRMIWFFFIVDFFYSLRLCIARRCICIFTHALFYFLYFLSNFLCWVGWLAGWVGWTTGRHGTARIT